MSPLRSISLNNKLILTQAQGDNISISTFAGTGTLAAGGTATTTLRRPVRRTATIQGLVTLQSNQGFALPAGASDVGLNTTSALSALSSINVSTQAGAGAAINVLSFALQQLENQGGQLGAVQQRLQATVSNLQVTNTNLTAARGVVQDANIPQVTTQLTQAEILQQAGISALSHQASCNSRSSNCCSSPPKVGASAQRGPVLGNPPGAGLPAKGVGLEHGRQQPPEF